MTAADDTTTRPASTATRMSRGTADLVSHALASDDRRAVALLRPSAPVPHRPGPREREAEP